MERSSTPRIESKDKDSLRIKEKDKKTKKATKEKMKEKTSSLDSGLAAVTATPALTSSDKKVDSSQAKKKFTTGRSNAGPSGLKEKKPKKEKEKLGKKKNKSSEDLNKRRNSMDMLGIYGAKTKTGAAVRTLSDVKRGKRRDLGYELEKVSCLHALITTRPSAPPQ